MQDIEFARTGKLPVATCRGRTRRDYMFLSPELIRRFIRCEVDTLAWTDHATLKTFFQGQDGSDVRSVWPVPCQIDWKLAAPERPDVVVDFVGIIDADESYHQFWNQKEQQVCEGARSQGVVLPSITLGRGARKQPKMSNAPTPPVKMGRAGDLKPSFHGFVMMHLQWFRQLRRLQHYSRLARSSLATQKQLRHQTALWASIRKASGFKPDFPTWWEQQVRSEGFPAGIPLHAPPSQLATLIFDAFETVMSATWKRH